jgi:hypothetical protein
MLDHFPNARQGRMLVVGVVLALMTYVASYDVSGREPACFEAESELREDHPDAVEFRGVSGDWSLTQSCEALGASGKVLGQ